MRRSTIRLASAYIALTLLTVPLCTWFALHAQAVTGIAQARLDALSTPGLLHIERMDWSLFPLRLDLYDVTLLSRGGEPSLTARHIGVVPRWSESHRWNRDIAIHVDRVEIDDFNLHLTWNKRGRLELSDAFRLRVFDAKKVKRPPWQVVVDAPKIILRNGNLNLNWPETGFQFKGISTQGKLWITQDDFVIDVPELRSAEGEYWHNSPPSALKERLSQVMPPRAATGADTSGLHVPLKDVAVDDFVWGERGFRATVSLQAPPNEPTHVSGSMRFLADGIHHDLSATIALDERIVSALTGGHVTGPAGGSFHTKGVNFAGSATGNALEASGLKLGSLTFKEPTIPSIHVQTTGEEATVDARVEASMVSTKKFLAEDVHLHALGALGWAGWSADSFVQQMRTNPKSLLRRFTLFGAPHASLKIPEGRAKTLISGETSWNDVTLTSLSLRGELRNLVGKLESITAKQGAALSASLTTNLLSMGLTLSHTKTDTSLLRRWYGDREEWQQHPGATHRTVVSLRSPITKPLSFQVNKVTMESVQ